MFSSAVAQSYHSCVTVSEDRALSWKKGAIPLFRRVPVKFPSYLPSTEVEPFTTFDVEESPRKGSYATTLLSRGLAGAIRVSASISAQRADVIIITTPARSTHSLGSISHRTYYPTSRGRNDVR